MLGWRLIVPQQDGEELINRFNVQRTKVLMNEAMKSNPRLSVLSVIGTIEGNEAATKRLRNLETDQTSPEEKWNKVHPRSVIDEDEGSEWKAPPLPTPDSELSEARMPAVPSTESDTDSTSIQSDGILPEPTYKRQARLRRLGGTPASFFSPPPPSSTPIGISSTLFTQAPVLSGADIRTIALRSITPRDSNSPTFPHPVHAVIARTDPNCIHIHDSVELSTPLPKYSYFSGRVFLLGDAAHPFVTAPGIYQDVSTSLEISDAVQFARIAHKWIALAEAGTDFEPLEVKEESSGFMGRKSLSLRAPPPPESLIMPDWISKALFNVGVEFDERVAVCNAISKEVKSAGGKPMVAGILDNSVVRGLLKYTAAANGGWDENRWDSFINDTF